MRTRHSKSDAVMKEETKKPVVELEEFSEVQFLTSKAEDQLKLLETTN